jgi:catechol 2,3-dioxygenase-like lactoylglutathione lyase family enzyme
MEQRLSVVTLGVADLPRARKFYEKGLGWTPSAAGNEHVVFFQVGGMVISLWSRAELAKDARVADDGEGFSGVALAHNVRERGEVDRVIAKAGHAGARILKLLRRSGRAYLGSRLESILADRCGRQCETSGLG